MISMTLFFLLTNSKAQVVISEVYDVSNAGKLNNMLPECETKSTKNGSVLCSV